MWTELNKTIRAAIASWPHTLRFMAVLLLVGALVWLVTLVAGAWSACICTEVPVVPGVLKPVAASRSPSGACPVGEAQLVVSWLLW